MLEDVLKKIYIQDLPSRFLFDLFVLSFFRIGGFIAFSPIFVKPAFSGIVRTGFFFSLGFIIVPHVFIELDGKSLEPSILFVTAIKEVILGFFLGFLAWLVVHAIQFAGVIIDTQRGATTSQDLNPLLTTTTTGLSNLLVHAFVAYFFAMGGFIVILEMILTSYNILPILSPLPKLDSQFKQFMFKETAAILKYGLILAAPIIIATLIVDLHIAYLSKKAQQIQPLTFSGPIKSAVAIFLIIFSLDQILPDALKRMMKSLEATVEIMSPERL